MNFMKRLFLIFYFFLTLISVQATDFPFRGGEELAFDIHYKYGLIMLKAGTANYKVVENNYKNQNSYLTTLDFKTSSFFDKIFKIRDTLRSKVTEDFQPLHHKRLINEGNYQFTEEVIFNKFSASYTEVRVRRESRQVSRFDTILVSNSMSYDMLSLMAYICSLDFSQMGNMQEETTSAFIGKEKVNVTIRNEGQTILEKSDTLKYKTYKIALDFSDSNFNESKNAIEIWMSDDKNRIPLKIKAKLRIGAAEVYLTSWKNLKYPLSSEVKIPVK